MIVHKFGGSSLASAVQIENVYSILDNKNEAVVVSASAKTTSDLYTAIDNATNQQEYVESLNKILHHHSKLINDLLPNNTSIIDTIISDLKAIKHILSTMTITGFCADSLKHFVLGFGEMWSATILTEYLKSKGTNAYYIDASECLIVNDRKFPVIVNWQESLKNINNIIDRNKADVYVITGFIAQNKFGKRTILGLNCSDYSASIFAKLLQAESLYIWTDVAGVFSANPQVVPEASPLERLTYKEALELAYFGASVVHPLTIAPMALENTPIYIKSSYDPSLVGTKISSEIDTNQGLIKGLTSVSNVTMVRVQGAGMIGVSGISVKIFGALQQQDISVMMISQASSEYSICFAIETKNADTAIELLNNEFESDIKNNLIEEIVVDKHYSLITAVGEGMKSKTGSLSSLVHSLTLANINIHAIAQGSSERSVTFSVKTEDEGRAVQAMHRHYNTTFDDIAIAVIGAGNVGKEFIKQLKSTHSKWREKAVNLVLIGATNSKNMRLDYDNLLYKNIDSLLDSGTDNIDLDKLAEFVSRASASKKIVIDATANQEVASKYLKFLEKGVNVITPNKYANSGDVKYYDNIRETAAMNNVKFLYETNVCAGLPLINTIQNMISSGDKIESIQGIMSGTLSYLFTKLNQGLSFTDAVKMAYDAGYTEPDPRQDLSGMDVARKTVILAREIGVNISLDDLDIENLVPEELRDCSVEDFFLKLPEFNDQIMQQIQDKKQKLAGVHYVGTISGKSASVGIQAYDNSSPFAAVSGTDNIVMIQSERYIQPLVVQGAGAGLAVTAAGIYSDVISIVQ